MKNRAVRILGISLAVVTLASAGGGFLLWQKYQSALDDNTELHSEITTLRNGGTGSNGLGVQGASGTGMLGASTQAGSSDTSSGSGSSAPSDGTKTMLVKDFGIKFQIAPDLTDLTYAESPPASGYLALTTQALQTAYPSCAGAGILGALFRYPKGQPLPATAAATKAQRLTTAGSYDYYYIPPDKDPCTNKTAIASINHGAGEVAAALKSITEQ